MLKSSTKVFMTPKNLTTAEMTNTTRNLSSEVTVKTSLLSRVSHPWITISIGLIAVAGILGTVGIAVVSFAVLRSTTLSTITTTTTSTTSTTTPTMCFILSSSRPSNVWLTVDNMSTARIYHTSTLISQDNSVLIAGGSNGGLLISTEKYISSTGCFQRMGNMPRTRQMHTADQLPALSGYVLLAGGTGAGGSLVYADLFDPMTSNTVTISLSLARYRHTSAILSSSKLILVGGMNQTGLLDSGDGLNVGSNSVFTIATGTLPTPCIGHTITRFGNTTDMALIAGGTNGGSGFYTTAIVYQGSTNTFIPLPSGVVLPTGGRAFHTATYLPPPIHKILIIGGGAYYVVYQTMILFDIATFTFTALPNILIYPRSYHTATLLPNGKVLLVGGLNTNSLKSCELIDPFNNYSSTSMAPLNTNRYLHTATLIHDNNNGTILVCGGQNGNVYLNSCELYFV